MSLYSSEIRPPNEYEHVCLELCSYYMYIYVQSPPPPHTHTDARTHAHTHTHTHAHTHTYAHTHMHSVEEEAFEVAALLIVLRPWRIIRIVNG